MSADPVTAAIIIGTTLARHQEQKSAAKAQARVLEESATRVREEAAFEEAEVRRRNRQLLGRQRALFSKSGVKLEGTPLLVQSETVEDGEIDALMRRRRGDTQVASILGRADAVRAAGSGFPLFR